MKPISSISPNSRFVSGLSHFKNPDAILPTLLIEAACTAGRTSQSYKRGGKLEASERFREEATSAVFWLFGVKWLNKLGDFVGSKILGIKDFATDVGKDALRDPAYALSNKAKIFKFSKIAASVLIATTFMGFVVPRINHAITAREMKDRKEEDNIKENLPSIHNFISSVQDKNYKKATKLAFMGGGGFIEALTRVSHNLENNNKWRLLSTDTGMVMGRVANSRHPAEATEYLFRDTTSSYFYNFATANVIFAMTKLLKTPAAHPKALSTTGEFLAQKIGEDKLSSGEFLSKYISKTNNFPDLKVPYTQDDTILLKDFSNFLAENKIDDENILKKALHMSELQPKYHGESILSKMQVEDIFSDAKISNPKFLRKAIDAATDGRATDPTKFVSRKDVERIRTNITEFGEWIAKQAAKSDAKIDANFIQKMTKKSLMHCGAYQVLGMAVSAFGLAILIPKLQMVVSKALHGEASFEEIAKGKEDKTDKTQELEKAAN